MSVIEDKDVSCDLSNIQKTLIQVSGEENCGKTSSINKVYELLLKYPKVVDTKFGNANRNEIYRTLTFKCGLKIGIVSMGDYMSKKLKNCLEQYFETCHIIIAASRDNESQDVYAYLTNECTNKRFQQTKVPKEKDTIHLEEKSNQTFADNIVDLIRNIAKDTM
jgi:hypothetical protein